MRSLQSKLLLWMGTAQAIILMIAGMAIYFAVQNALLNQFDASLDRAARTLSLLVETDGNQIESEMVEDGLLHLANTEFTELYQLIDAQGQVVESSGPFEVSLLPSASSNRNKLPFESITFPDGRPGRLVAIRFEPRFEPAEDHTTDVRDRTSSILANGDDAMVAKTAGGGQRRSRSEATLVVLRDTSDLNKTLGRIRWLIAFVTLLAVITGLSISALVANMGLRPLRNAVGQVSKIDGKNLDIRLDPLVAPTEVQPTIVALNQMLDRLKKAFQRERAFSSNVAHELRTPLAGIKSTIEVAVSKNRERNEYKSSLYECLSICDETQTIIENLFTLARVDSGNCSLQTESVDLSNLARDTWTSLERQIAIRNVNVRWQMDGAIELFTDKDKLRLVFRNLFDNAVSHSPESDTIDIGCEKLNGKALFRITNHAINLTQSDMPHVCERFWRSDKSRSQTGQHSGLGLSLCHSLIERMGGMMETKLIEDNRFTVELKLPLTQQPMSNIKTFPNPADLAAAFAADFSAWTTHFLSDQETMTVALSGGSTPKLLFELWASQYSDTIDWNRIHFFWGDERCVAAEDSESNYGTAKRLWLDPVGILDTNVHPVQGEIDPQSERLRYEKEIKQYVTSNAEGLPEFDLILLGMGTDGHTASIFPNQNQFLKSTKICEVATHPQSGQQRITLTGPVINAAKHVAFLITGADKANVLEQVILKTGDWESYPASHIAAQEVDFYLDDAAHAF